MIGFEHFSSSIVHAIPMPIYDLAGGCGVCRIQIKRVLFKQVQVHIVFLKNYNFDGGIIWKWKWVKKNDKSTENFRILNDMWIMWW